MKIMTASPTPFVRLTLQLILTLMIAAILTTTLLVLVFSPIYPASASTLPAIQSSRQANYRAESVHPIFAPVYPQGFDSTLP
ncbi:hypothetical protein BECAL_00881 [Bellilinea caldifistulae]|uniref:Uncharacterized protein n=1 Tax=Bellilinea caldifistulae TaxID=360411 RepID=A0A0P6WZ75_9CHLR|nr:hypothetical protein [Bellilinea caldifistulae]KPL75318.1 hypothetical protein AC812_08440 [Bellilinea caldifistulae]GAP09730.1 hypothetical protein BECAL_00881 [Bellilinea caldifistulae]